MTREDIAKDIVNVGEMYGTTEELFRRLRIKKVIMSHENPNFHAGTS